MPKSVTDLSTRATDYRLNQLGVRVHKNTCQLISKLGNEWIAIGPRWKLPIRVPLHDKDLPLAHALSITAYQFAEAWPESGLLQALTQEPAAPAQSRPAQSRPARADVTPRGVKPWQLPKLAHDGNVIADSRALIRSSRELLARGVRETV